MSLFEPKNLVELRRALDIIRQLVASQRGKVSKVSPLEPSATLEQVVAKVNELLEALK